MKTEKRKEQRIILSYDCKVLDVKQGKVKMKIRDKDKNVSTRIFLTARVDADEILVGQCYRFTDIIESAGRSKLIFTRVSGDLFDSPEKKKIKKSLNQLIEQQIDRSKTKEIITSTKI